MDMATIHISEADAARDFAGLMARVRAGAEIVIENGAVPVAVIHTPVPSRRSISECIALASKHEEETGEAPVLDPDFAADVEEIVASRQPWNPPAWESPRPTCATSSCPRPQDRLHLGPALFPRRTIETT